MPTRISPLTRGKRLVDLVRGSVGGGFELACSGGEVRRGDRVSVTVTIAEPSASAAPDLEVGLVCTETYATYLPQERLTKSDRALVDAVAYERWLELDGSQPEQIVTLEVPVDAPFTYDGKHLKFTWRVAARRRTRGLDPTRAEELHVLP